MIRLKGFTKSKTLEDWLNAQAQMGNQCIAAFPDYYFFLFKKSEQQVQYQVEALSFMRNENRTAYIKMQQEHGKRLVNNSISDGFYIYELLDTTSASPSLEKANSLNPMFIKSFICNLFIALLIFFLKTFLKLEDTDSIYHIMTGLGVICIGLSTYSLVNLFINEIRFEKALMINKNN